MSALLPILETERLRLEPLKTSDSKFIFPMMANPQVMAFWDIAEIDEPDIVDQVVAGQVDEMAQGRAVYWAIRTLADDAFIGTCDLSGIDRRHKRAEVAFMLDRESWGNGYAQEAMTAVTAYAASDGIRRLLARTQLGNRRSDTLLAALEAGAGDAVIASIAITPETRAKADFSDRYYRTPARFAAKKDSTLKEISPELIAGKSVAVVAGSAHEAYIRTFFAETAIKSFPSAAEAFEALKKGDAELVFSDGIALAFWLNGSESAGCCAFRGGPYTESRFFGEGVGIAVKTGNETLVRALNYALYRLWERGVFTDLYLRYFPVGFY